jgi:hypothetical protein
VKSGQRNVGSIWASILGKTPAPVPGNRYAVICRVVCFPPMDGPQWLGGCQSVRQCDTITRGSADELKAKIRRVAQCGLIGLARRRSLPHEPGCDLADCRRLGALATRRGGHAVNDAQAGAGTSRGCKSAAEEDSLGSIWPAVRCPGDTNAGRSVDFGRRQVHPDPVSRRTLPGAS